MNNSERTLKHLSLVALAALAAWLVGGIVFYKERLFFADSSFIVFNIIKKQGLAIQEHRYGSFITQMVPLLAVKLHLPIKMVLKAYTFSFGFFFLAAGFVVHRCRQYALVVIMALYYYLLVSDTWFWTNNEIHQAVAWMFICIAVTLRMGELKVKPVVLLPVFLLLAFLAIYTHFIVLIPFAFLWGFLWIRQEGWPFSRGMSVLLSSCIVLIVACKFLVVQSKSYDDEHLHNLTHLSLKDIFLAFNSGGVRKFVMRCLGNYWLVFFIFPAGLITAWKANKKPLAFWCAAAFTGYVCVMGITYPQGDILKFHIESEWQSMAIIMSALFVFYFMPRVEVRKAILLLSVIFIVRIGYIAAARDKFTWRTAFTKEVMVQMKKKGITKLAIANEAALKEKYILDWAVANECMLMSAMQKDEPQMTFTFIDTNYATLLTQLKDPKVVAASFDLVHPNDWNYDYYKPDTTHAYAIMTYSELFK
ncbi:hypothetical protein CJD36_010015 [Flavipsychrobacter stenotrophus]|uniref:Glycosyltransferase RgtA/B/C/D-like domain-containing protein n=1 Tax=Flavipsychrobacter stenotrophus TaxID=2077091 RepID=A0A2S7SYW4_9BACT|nr:hypothetical protein [Flavipsychrobacter stenotrophus]PQJ12112.1 hypothetical protein CJD36_010015 [Flavipsychrobacter stenotrophus]